MSAPLLADLEGVAAALTAGAGGGAGNAALPQALAAALRPERVLLIGSDGGLTAAAVVAAAGPSLRTLVSIDPWLDSLERAAVRLEACLARVAADPDVHLHHATLWPVRGGAPHFTRMPALVDLLTAGFDLVLLAPAADPAALHLELTQLLALVRDPGLLACAWTEGAGPRLDAARRVVAEANARAVRWAPAADVPGAALVSAGRLRRTHEETAVLRDALLAGDRALAAARAAGDDHAVCVRLRHWLAERLVWSTKDLLLPLAALPPPLGVVDVVELCERREGGVWGYGGAVTLAMLYRAFGYPATVYPFGVPELFAHMMTLVALRDGRLLLQDALFDAEPCRDGRPVPWGTALELAARGDIGRLTFASGCTRPRPHLYSRASLPAAEAGGQLAAAERCTLEAALAGCRPGLSEPRAALAQTFSCSLEAYAAVPAHAAALREVARRTGIAHPLGLLCRPFGNLPLTGDAACDAEIARVLSGGAAPVAPGAAGA